MGRDLIIMETSEDRGIECKGLCFDYVDGEVILSVYQNLPGIDRELAGTTFRKTFSKDEWGEINRHLMGTLEMIEEVLGEADVEEEEDEDEEESIPSMSIPRIVGNDGKE